MVIFLKSDGSIAYRTPESINCGGRRANKITLVAPFSESAVVTVAFGLSNGATYGPDLVSPESATDVTFEGGQYTMTKLEEIAGYSFEGQRLTVWEYELNSKLTAVPGTLRIQFFITADSETIPTDVITAYVDIGITPVEPSLPDGDGEGSVYQRILKYLSDSNSFAKYAEDAKGKAEDAKGKAETARDEAEAAQRKAEAARDEAEAAQMQAEAAQEKAEAARDEAEAAQMQAEAAQEKAETAALDAQAAAKKLDYPIEEATIKKANVGSLGIGDNVIVFNKGIDDSSSKKTGIVAYIKDPTVGDSGVEAYGITAENGFTPHIGKVCVEEFLDDEGKSRGYKYTRDPNEDNFLGVVAIGEAETMSKNGQLLEWDSDQEKIVASGHTAKEFVEITDRLDHNDAVLRQFGVITEEIKNEVANRILVPARSDRFMYLNRIGGKSYSTENYLNPKYFSGDSYGGLTVTNNGNGTITLNGTVEMSGPYVFTINVYNPPAKSQPANGWYFSIDKPMPENLAIVVWAGDGEYSEDGYWVYGDATSIAINHPYLNSIQILPPYDSEGGTVTVDNLTLKLTYSKGEAKEYTPYFDGLIETKVTSLWNNSANLIPFDPVKGYADGWFKEANGITFTVNASGRVRAKGTATRQTLFTLARSMGELHTDSVYALNNPVTKSGKIFKDCYFYYRDKSLLIEVQANTTVDITYDPMITYREIITTDIPEDIQKCDGYGRGVNNTYYNYIDLEREVYVKNVERYVVTGDEALSISTTAEGVETDYAEYGINNSSFNATVENTTINLTSSYYTPGTRYQVYDRLKANYICITGSNLRWSDRIMTEAEMRAKLKTTPLVVDYVLAKPDEYPISEIMSELKPLIPVEQGGSIDLVSDTNNAVPYTATFNIINSN